MLNLTGLPDDMLLQIAPSMHGTQTSQVRRETCLCARHFVCLQQKCLQLEDACVCKGSWSFREGLYLIEKVVTWHEEGLFRRCTFQPCDGRQLVVAEVQVAQRQAVAQRQDTLRRHTHSCPLRDWSSALAAHIYHRHHAEVEHTSNVPSRKYRWHTIHTSASPAEGDRVIDAGPG